MKKILVCGATGFIGRNLAEYFAQDTTIEVYGTYYKSPPLNHPSIRMIYADLTDKKDVSRVVKGMDVVIHAAAVTSGIKEVNNNPHKIIAENAVMTSLVLRSCYDNQVNHIFIFSCSIMYRSASKPLKEVDLDLNATIYPNYFGGAWNKIYFEKMCEFYSRLEKNKFTVIRHSNIYGPHDKFDLEKSHVFAATITKVMNSTSNKITIWGTGEEQRDLLHVSDLARFVALSLDNQKENYGLYNVGYGESISVRSLVEKIIVYSGKKLEIEHDLSQPSNKTTVSLDYSKAKMELGWKPKVSLSTGIKNTMDWYKNYHQTI